MSLSKKTKSDDTEPGCFWFTILGSDMQLILLQAKRDAIFHMVKKIYDLSLDIHTNSEKREQFLDRCSSVDTLRSVFKSVLDQFNMRLLSIYPQAKPDYGKLDHFETLYSTIKMTWIQYMPRDTTQSDSDATALNEPSPKLPTLDILTLPSFSGNVHEWENFYYKFNTIIHRNPRLTDSEKLCYLLYKLSGNVLSEVTSDTTCEGNYHLTLQTLVDKYDDKRMFVSSYLNQLFEFQRIQSATIDNFSLFKDAVVGAVRGLQNLKLDNLLDLIFVHIALDKLDSETVQLFELRYGSQMPTFARLVEFINIRIKALVRESPNSKTVQKTKIPNTKNPGPTKENPNTILLPTAQIVVYDTAGARHIIRALLDSAAQSHFITQKCCELLGIKLQNAERTPVRGFSGVEKFVSADSVEFKFHSRFDDNINFTVSSLVVDHVTALLPTAEVDKSVLPHVAGLRLADDNFGTPNEIDVLIGASLFPYLFLPNIVHAPSDSSLPPALNTVLGYIVMGEVPTTSAT